MKQYFILLLVVILGISAGCKRGGGNEPVAPVDTTAVDTENIIVPSPSLRQEPYREQVHYSVHHNWSNDPNGLFYKDGVWHLYYQYNPDGIGCDFGRMSWGHAFSSDLMHWKECSPVLYPDNMGAMFSGSSIVDVNNKAGFGEGAVLAFYTASAEKQLICLAVSTDNGTTFVKYDKNPIIPSMGLNNFRDPKVVWDEKNQQYVMVIAKGWDRGLEFWRSTNLIDWQFVPYIFHSDIHRCNLGQYECPDLIPFGDKWVLIMSTNPGGYITGSGTMYFVGEMTAEGYFVADNDEYPRWLDYGADNYAMVTWDNAPDGRKVAIGWMNNWDYAPAVPCEMWKAAYTIPREYELRELDGRYVLCTEPVIELNTLAKDWKELDLEEAETYSLQGDTCLDAYEMVVNLSGETDACIRLLNQYNEYFEIRLDSRCQKILVNRSRSGITNFSPVFAVPSMSAPIVGDCENVNLHLVVDQSSVELFVNGGSTCVTNLVFPRTIYTNVIYTGTLHNASYRELQTIWKE